MLTDTGIFQDQFRCELGVVITEALPSRNAKGSQK